jgi:hypothetical protein
MSIRGLHSEVEERSPPHNAFLHPALLWTRAHHFLRSVVIACQKAISLCSQARVALRLYSSTSQRHPRRFRLLYILTCSDGDQTLPRTFSPRGTVGVQTRIRLLDFLLFRRRRAYPSLI